MNIINHTKISILHLPKNIFFYFYDLRMQHSGSSNKTSTKPKKAKPAKKSVIKMAASVHKTRNFWRFTRKFS